MLKLRFNNKEHGDVWLVEPAVLVGSDAACQAVLKRDGIQPRHIEILVKGNQLNLVNLCGDKTLKVNGQYVGTAADIKAGDDIALVGMSLAVVDPKQEAKTAVPVATSEWAIRPIHSALANKVYPIQATTVIGRAPECDLNFSVTHLSRKHAELFFQNGHLMVKDLGSANGTYVNGKQVQEATKLAKGDELRLDTLSFSVIGPGGAPGTGDSDKTVMRAAVTIPPAGGATGTPTPPPAAHAAPAAHASRAAHMSAQEREKKVAGVSALNRAVTASEAAKDAASSSPGMPGWIMAAVALVAVVAVIAYVLMGSPL